MPPIPIYSDAPINAAKADGVTPQTAYTPTPTTDNGAVTSGAAPAYPAARPGAAAVPAPTGSVSRPQPPPRSRTTQAQGNQQDGPPAPQPGAVPTAPTQTQASTSGSIPPPPRAGQSASSGPAQVTTMPPQMSMPAPYPNAAPTHSTSAALPPPPSATHSGPTTISLGAAPAPSQTSQYAAVPEANRSSFEHPAGYTQNPYAMELTAQQRALLEAQEAAERPGRNSLSEMLGGGGGSGSDFGGSSGAAGSEGVWGAVKGWASTAGQKAAQLEETVWSKVNGNGK